MSILGVITIGFAGVLAAIIVGGFLWMKVFASGPEFRHGKCPRCRQRLRFQSKKAGRAGECPRCRHRFTLAADVRSELDGGKRTAAFSS